MIPSLVSSHMHMYLHRFESGRFDRQRSITSNTAGITATAVQFKSKTRPTVVDLIFNGNICR